MKNPPLGLKSVRAIALAVTDEARAIEFYGRPSDELNACITLEVDDARETEQALISVGVTICDPIADYGGHPVGAFLDSEGNKIWFCSKR